MLILKTLHIGFQLLEEGTLGVFVVGLHLVVEVLEEGHVSDSLLVGETVVGTLKDPLVHILELVKSQVELVHPPDVVGALPMPVVDDHLGEILVHPVVHLLLGHCPVSQEGFNQFSNLPNPEVPVEDYQLPFPVLKAKGTPALGQVVADDSSQSESCFYIIFPQCLGSIPDFWIHHPLRLLVVREVVLVND